MVLTSSNSGKYLSKRWNDMRAKAFIDRTQFSAEELVWLEIGANEGTGEFDKTNFVMDSQPVDMHAPLGPPRIKTLDVRHRPGMDKEDE